MGSKPSGEPKFTRHVDNEYPDLTALFAAGDEVLALLEHPGWSHVMRILNAEVAEIDRTLDGMSINSPLTHEQLCIAHGRRWGLNGASRAAQALLGVSERKRQQQRDRHELAAEPA